MDLDLLTNSPSFTRRDGFVLVRVLAEARRSAARGR
jgi:hypothetical protein